MTQASLPDTAQTPSPPAAEPTEPSLTGLFDEPDGYYPPTPPPTTQTHTLLSGQQVTLHLVGHSPLEAHHVWNGSRAVAEWLERRGDAEVAGRTVLELGAAAGLPSLVCAARGARKVVMTDFPDVEIVTTMQKNIDDARAGGLLPTLPLDGNGDDQEKNENGEKWDSARSSIVARGYVWGTDVGPLLDVIRPAVGFDLLILADLLFRHSEHGHILDTVANAMLKSPASKALVFFTSYRPWLRHKDMAFFDLARERGFVVTKLLEQKLERPLFKDDPGDIEVQKTVTGWSLSWPA